jgi:hypothetical protein
MQHHRLASEVHRTLRDMRHRSDERFIVSLSSTHSKQRITRQQVDA